MNKTQHWAKIRAELKREFIGAGIESCERCGGNFALSFAHRVKRRFITDDAELKMVALLCFDCHNWTEYGTKDEPGTHERMSKIITEIIEGRK